MKTLTCQAKGRRSGRVRQLLESVTSYPWRRNYKGDLCGANGRPIFFQGSDAVIVQHAPLMLKTLLAIRTVVVKSERGSTLDRIRLLADNVLDEVEQAHADGNWCRGSIE